MDVIGLAAEALKPISDEGTIVQQGWYDESLKRLHVTLWKLRDTEDAHSDDECEIESSKHTSEYLVAERSADACEKNKKTDEEKRISISGRK